MLDLFLGQHLHSDDYQKALGISDQLFPIPQCTLDHLGSRSSTVVFTFSFQPQPRQLDWNAWQRLALASVQVILIEPRLGGCLLPSFNVMSESKGKMALG